MLAELFDKLILDDRAPQVVDLVKVETDAERVARYAAKVEEAKRLLGDKYLCHESRRVQRIEVAA